MPDEPQQPFLERARANLLRLWEQLEYEDCCPDKSGIPDEILQAIVASINSKTKTYRYVLPTQLLAKYTDPALNSRAVQAGADIPGAFDARSLCHKVIVPFDRQRHNVLGGSAEPYLNNPLRIPAIISAARTAQKDKTGFDNLLRVLKYTEDQPDRTGLLLDAVLRAVYDRFQRISISYPVPNRPGLLQALRAVNAFVHERTGSLRLQTVAKSLFAIIGLRFQLFTQVITSSINAADASTGSAADLECLDEAGAVVLAVEVKDRQLTLHHTQDKLPAMRSKGITEFLYLVQGGVEARDAEALSQLIEREFATGQNLYVTEFRSFLETCLVLFGEEGRRSFLQEVGKELDASRADLGHREVWRRLMEDM